MGTANANQLIAFAFPNDDLDARTEFPRLRAEVAECYHVQWYTVDSRPYYAIPTWDDHQKNERRAKGKFPTPDQADSPITEKRGASVRKRGDSGAGTGEQGNRGTGEQGNRGAGADAPLSPFCSKHSTGSPDPCRACGVARLAYEKHLRDEKNKPTWTPTRDPECTQHIGYPLPCHRCAEDNA